VFSKARYIQEVTKLRNEHRGRTIPPEDQAEERFLNPISTGFYNQTENKREEDYTVLAGMDHYLKKVTTDALVDTEDSSIEFTYSQKDSIKKNVRC
jgi:hypothetical protein